MSATGASALYLRRSADASRASLSLGLAALVVFAVGLVFFPAWLLAIGLDFFGAVIAVINLLVLARAGARRRAVLSLVVCIAPYGLLGICFLSFRLLTQ